MANQKITDLTEKASLASDDLFEIVDSVTGTNKKVKSSTILPEANTWYVNPAAQGGNGSPQKPYTVDEAMAAASEGDIIIFQRGTYTADITVTKHKLTFIGQAEDACIIDIENFVIDTDAGTLFLFLQNLDIRSDGITQGTNLGLLIFRRCIGDFNASIVVDRVFIEESNFSISGSLTTKGPTTVRNIRLQCATWTIEGTGNFYNSTINANILATGQTVLIETSKVEGDVDCANLTYNNTVITGTKIGTSSTTVNNQ